MSNGKIGKLKFVNFILGVCEGSEDDVEVEVEAHRSILHQDTLNYSKSRFD